MNIPRHHIENAILYLQDLKETDKPWERWQYKMPEEGWKDLQGDPFWAVKVEYRRKPKTIKATIEIPEPERKELRPGQKYYCADFLPDGEPTYSTWTDSPMDHLRLKSGVIHLTKEGAVAHLNTLLSVTKGETK